MINFPVRLLVVVGVVAVGPFVLHAAEPAAKAEASSPAPQSTGTPANTPEAPAASKNDVLELPKIEVTAKRVKELDREIKRLDKAIAREKKNVKATDLDKVLNNSKLAGSVAIFGGNSAAYLEQVAATRVRYMETERELLSDMRQPRTLDELTLLQTELEKIRTMRRELDKTGH